MALSLPEIVVMHPAMAAMAAAAIMPYRFWDGRAGR